MIVSSLHSFLCHSLIIIIFKIQGLRECSINQRVDWHGWWKDWLYACIQLMALYMEERGDISIAWKRKKIGAKKQKRNANSRACFIGWNLGLFLFFFLFFRIPLVLTCFHAAALIIIIIIIIIDILEDSRSAQIQSFRENGQQSAPRICCRSLSSC